MIHLTKERLIKMKKIYLFCAAGMSTSLLAKKMQKAAEEAGCDYYVKEFAIAEINQKGQEADIILLGPQVRYELNKIKEQMPNKPVEAIDMMAYGMMDGKKVIDHVIEVLGK
jgi:cellobiose PTS system EIIB component